jgi:hypothetical protein
MTIRDVTFKQTLSLGESAGGTRHSGQSSSRSGVTAFQEQYYRDAQAGAGWGDTLKSWWHGSADKLTDKNALAKQRIKEVKGAKPLLVENAATLKTDMQIEQADVERIQKEIERLTGLATSAYQQGMNADGTVKDAAKIEYGRTLREQIAGLKAQLPQEIEEAQAAARKFNENETVRKVYEKKIDDTARAGEKALRASERGKNARDVATRLEQVENLDINGGDPLFDELRRKGMDNENYLDLKMQPVRMEAEIQAGAARSAVLADEADFLKSIGITQKAE